MNSTVTEVTFYFKGSDTRLSFDALLTVDKLFRLTSGIAMSDIERDPVVRELDVYLNRNLDLWLPPKPQNPVSRLNLWKVQYMTCCI